MSDLLVVYKLSLFFISNSEIYLNPALINADFPLLLRIGSDLAIYKNAVLSRLTMPSLSVLGSYLQIDTNPIMTRIDVGALQTTLGSFTVNLPILYVLNASSLRNVAGSLFVSRCVQADFFSFVDSSAIQLYVCNVGLGNVFPAKKAVVCVQCQPGFYKSVMSTGGCVVCPVGQTSNAEASNCFGGACADVLVPDYGCVNATVVVTATPGNGSWMSSNASVVTFADSNSGSTSFKAVL